MKSLNEQKMVMGNLGKLKTSSSQVYSDNAYDSRQFEISNTVSISMTNENDNTDITSFTRMKLVVTLFALTTL